MSLGYRKGIISAAVNGPTLTAAATASCIPAAAKAALAGNFFDAEGQILIVDLWGKISCAVTTPGTARFDIRLGGTVIWDSLAILLNIIAKSNVGFHLHAAMTLQTRGAAANFMQGGYFASEAIVGSVAPTAGPSGLVLLPFNTAPAAGNNFDATAAQQLDAQFTQTVATGSMTVTQAVVESYRWE